MGTDIALSTMGATSDVSSAWNWLDGVYQAIAGAQAANLGGQLTPAQVAAIKAQTDAQITQAAGGNADLAASEIAAANSEIDSVIAQSGTTPGTPWYVWAALLAGAGALVYGLTRWPLE